MNLIKHFRKKSGLTIRELSVKSEVSIGYLSDLENDGTGSTNPSKDVMTRIALALGHTVPAVFFPEEVKKTQGGVGNAP